MIKTLIKTHILQKLTNFQINVGGQQRSVGDMVEYKIKNIVLGLSEHELVENCLEPRSKKSTEDVTIQSKGISYFIDSKTHDTKSEFSMPNLISIEKLRKILPKNDVELIYIFVDYELNDEVVVIKSVEVKYIWELDFSILSIGSLGKGQLQIANLNNPLKFTDEGKMMWFEKLKSEVKVYHDKRIRQIEKDKLKWV